MHLDHGLLERGAGFLLFLVGFGMGRLSGSFLLALFTASGTAPFAAATEAAILSPDIAKRERGGDAGEEQFLHRVR